MVNENPMRHISSSEEEPTGYGLYVIMEDLLEKLKLLNYDEEPIKDLKMRPLSRHYFASQTNSGEQFFMFTALSAWLIQKNGLHFEQPQEYDDPNTTISTILDALGTLGFQVDFSPNKLKSGSGWYVLQTLTYLADKAIIESKLQYQMPVPPKDVEEIEIIDDEMELVLERVEEEMAAEDSDLDEDNILNLDDLYLASAFKESNKPSEILESNTTLENWNLELERVLPLLKVSVKSNYGDWRTHLESMKHHKSGLEDILSTITSQLMKLNTGIENVMQKITKRETLINDQLENLLEQYRVLQNELAEANDQYKEVNGGVIERQKLFTQIMDKLQLIKHEMEERGATMSDGSPLVHIKKSIKDIKREICEMDIQIAVMTQMMVKSKIYEKSMDSKMDYSSRNI